jgi:ribosomal protein RSM22 (predicted rRNA methylase)
MRWSCPPEIEEALWQASAAVLPAAALQPAALTRAIVDRSRRYTSERDRLHVPPGGPAADADLAARALFFAVADAAKLLVPLAELEGRQLLPAAAPLHVLDVGAGTGAMSLGVLAHLRHVTPAARIHVTAVDREAGALAIAARALASCAAGWGQTVEVTTVVQDLRRWRPPPRQFHLVLLGTVLNELAEDSQRSLLEQLLAATAAGGALVAIEPALRDTARALHALRDWVLARQLAHVFAPCTRTAASCPALVDLRDWCHEDRPTELPVRAARLGALTGLREHGLKFAYLVLRHQADALVPARDALVPLRVVSRPRKLKGRWECFVCGEQGRHRLTRLRRHSGRASELAQVDRGDVLLAPAGGVEPRADSALVPVKPAATCAD